MCRWTPRAKQGQLNAFFPEGCVWRPRSCPLGPWGGTRLAPPAAPLDVAEALCSQVYIEDSLGERIWVDSPHCRTFVDNIQTAFNTKMPPKSALLQGEAGRSGGELSAGERCWAAGPGFPAAVVGGAGAGRLPPRSQVPPGAWVPEGRLGARIHEALVCREQPSPLPHRGGGQPDGAADRGGEAQPRAGGPAHAQVGASRGPRPGPARARPPPRPPAFPPACLPPLA